MSRRRYWTDKPPVGNLLDFDSDLTNGLVGAWLFNEGAGLTVNNLAGPGSIALGSTVSWNSGPAGTGVKFSGSNYGTIAAGTFPAVGPAISVLCITAASTWTGNAGVLFERSTYQTTWNLQITNGRVVWQGGSSVSRIYGAVMSYSTNTTHAVLIADAGNTSHLPNYWVDGSLGNNSSGNAGGTVPQANTNAIYIGGKDAAGSYVGTIDLLYLWNRCLSAAEAISISADPYQVIQAPPSRKLYIPSGGSTYNVAATGHVNLSGAATANVIHNAAATGHVNLSGTLAGNVIHNAAATGHVNLSGTLAGNVVHNAAATGHVNLSGAASGTKFNLYSVSATGHVNLSGAAGANVIHNAAATVQLNLHGVASDVYISNGGANTYTVAATTHLNVSANSSDINYRGRFQRGARLVFQYPIGVSPVALPAAVLAATSAPSTPLWSGPAATQGTNNTFGFTYQIGSNLNLGTFQVTTSWSIGTTNYSQVQTFDLVDGGDSGGRVIAMAFSNQPDAKYVLAQLDSGRLVQGRNPRTS